MNWCINTCLIRGQCEIINHCPQTIHSSSQVHFPPQVATNLPFGGEQGQLLPIGYTLRFTGWRLLGYYLGPGEVVRKCVNWGGEEQERRLLLLNWYLASAIYVFHYPHPTPFHLSHTRCSRIQSHCTNNDTTIITPLTLCIRPTNQPGWVSRNHTLIPNHHNSVIKRY